MSMAKKVPNVSPEPDFRGKESSGEEARLRDYVGRKEVRNINVLKLPPKPAKNRRTPDDEIYVEPLRKGIVDETSKKIIPGFLKHRTVLVKENFVFINMYDIQVDSDVKLGEGNFGKVLFGKWKHVKVALKCSKLSKEEVLKEAEIISNLKHQNLIKMYGVTKMNNENILVLEYMSEGSLITVLKERDLEFDQLMSIACQIGEGMMYISSKLIIHRDLAARNILLRGNVAKISDFGLACVLPSESSVYKVSENDKLPMKWYPIETLNNLVFTLKSEVWSFGITLMELFTRGETPYQGQSFHQLITRGDRLPKPGNMRKELYVIIHSCWDSNPDRRPSYGNLVKELNSIKSTFYYENGRIEPQEYLLHETDHIIYDGIFNGTQVLVKQHFGLKSQKSFAKDFRMLLLLDELKVLKLLTYTSEDSSLRLLIEKPKGSHGLEYSLLSTLRKKRLVYILRDVLEKCTNWSVGHFGLLLMEIFSDHNVCWKETPEATMRDIEAGNISKPEECPNWVFEIIKMCCLTDTTKSPSIQYLKVYFSSKLMLPNLMMSH